MFRQAVTCLVRNGKFADAAEMLMRFGEACDKVCTPRGAVEAQGAPVGWCRRLAVLELPTAGRPALCLLPLVCSAHVASRAPLQANMRSSQCKAYLGASVVLLYAQNAKEAWQVGARNARRLVGPGCLCSYWPKSVHAHTLCVRAVLCACSRVYISVLVRVCTRAHELACTHAGMHAVSPHCHVPTACRFSRTR